MINLKKKSAIWRAYIFVQLLLKKYVTRAGVMACYTHHFAVGPIGCSQDQSPMLLRLDSSPKIRNHLIPMQEVCSQYQIAQCYDIYRKIFIASIRENWPASRHYDEWNGKVREKIVLLQPSVSIHHLDFKRKTSL